MKVLPTVGTSQNQLEQLKHVCTRTESERELERRAYTHGDRCNILEKINRAVGMSQKDLKACTQTYGTVKVMFFAGDS